MKKAYAYLELVLTGIDEDLVLLLPTNIHSLTAKPITDISFITSQVTLYKAMCNHS